MDELEEQGLGLAAFSYDGQEILADFSQQHGITYPLLSDPDSAAIKSYGVLNTVVDEWLGSQPDDNTELEAEARQYVTVTQRDDRFVGIPFPGTFVIDAEGRVTSRFFEDSYRERNTVANILFRLDADGPSIPGTEVTTEHLSLSTYPSDPDIVLGQRFSLLMDITPLPDMHVYAPGAEGYRVIALQIEPQPFVRVLPIRYPDSEIYHFEPMDERVPVYQRPFTLLQEVVPEVTQAARDAFEGIDTLTLEGTLQYQACDHSVCYNPVSIPLTWAMELKPLNRRSE